MTKILFISKGRRLSVKDGVLLVETEDDKIMLNIRNIEAVVVESTIASITAAALIYITDAKVPLIFCDQKYMPHTQCINMYSYYETSEKLLKQLDWSKERKFEIWKEIIKNKVENQKDVLLLAKGETAGDKKLSSYIEKIISCTTENELKNLEAVSAREYFHELFGKDFRRSDINTINACLNYGYSIIRSYISSVVVSKGFHPSIGIFHKNKFNTFNFSDDIIEIYRPIVDYTTYLKKDSFEEFNNEAKKCMLETVSSRLKCDGKLISLRNSIIALVDNIYAFFENQKQYFPHAVDFNYD